MFDVAGQALQRPICNVISFKQIIRRFAPFPLLLAAATAAETTGLPKNSPFQLRGGPAAPAAAANETLELAGVSSIVGKKPDLILYDKTAKKSHWIAEGETKEGIAVINYDERREEAVVKVNGVQKTLALRKTAGPVGVRPVATLPAGFNTPLPAPLPAPMSAPQSAADGFAPSTASSTDGPRSAAPAPAAPGSPAEIQTRQETEARMLVSDLLEIGMAQRRAYEEAQRKAAGGITPQPATSETPQVVPAQPAPQVQ